MPDHDEKAEDTSSKNDQKKTDNAESDGKSATELGESENVMEGKQSPEPHGKLNRFILGYWRNKAWTLPLTLLAIIGLLLVVPVTRYPIIGHFYKQQISFVILDAQTHQPVSTAAVAISGQGGGVFVNSKGKVTTEVPVGQNTFTITKRYYQTKSVHFLVPLRKPAPITIYLTATGRQVPVHVINKISGQPLANAVVSAVGTSAQTDNQGNATIVLPANKSSISGSIKVLQGNYNADTVTIKVTTKPGNANTFSVTPAGRVYFLSNLSGNIDVVSTNLDGSDRQTVLAGTGNEDPNNTVLLASRDWKYLALLSRRSSGQYPRLYLINTGNNQLMTIDSTVASYSLVGWDGHDFIYDEAPVNVQNWQSGQNVLKSYDADTGKTVTLDQSAASGDSVAYAAQDFGYNDTYITPSGSVVYIKEWYDGGAGLSGKQDQFVNINPDGTSRQVMKSISVPDDGSYQSIGSVAYNPDEIYYQVSNESGNTYYAYENGSVTQSNTVSDQTYQSYQENYPTYLQSPSGNQMFWAEQRDGKNSLFIGDQDGNNSNQIASLSDYTAYGWYTNSYLLVEKGGSELYIMPVGGGSALPISDYYKPPQNFNGYGGGYGGL